MRLVRATREAAPRAAWLLDAATAAVHPPLAVSVLPRRTRRPRGAPLHLAGRAVLLFARPNAGRTLGTLAGALAVATASASEPLLLKAFVDRLTAAAGAPHSAAAAGVMGGVALFVSVLGARLVGAAWVTTSTWRVKLGFEYQMRSRVAAKLSVLSPVTQSEIGTGGLRYAVDASAPQTAGAFTDVAFRVAPILTYVGIATWG